jgi:hypothetical protein
MVVVVVVLSEEAVCAKCVVSKRLSIPVFGRLSMLRRVRCGHLEGRRRRS